MPVTARALDLQAQLERQLRKITDQQTRDLVAAWVRAWDETAPDLQDAIDELIAQQTGGVVAKALVTRNARLLAALDQIGRNLTSLATQAGVRVLGDVRRVVEDAAARQAPIIAAQLPREAPGLPSTVNAATIDAIVRRTATQITARTYPLAPDAYDAVQRELLRGITVGTNPRHTAARILARTETEFNGGLTRALTISRTESLDAHRAGAQAGQEAHAGVLAGWVWLAHLDPRMCRACLAMNGTLHPLTEPGPLGHQNCRCSRMPKTRSWADLGYTGRSEPADHLPDSDAWFESLGPVEQRQILGRDGYEAWLAGMFPRGAWARRQSNPGWRDSMVPAKPEEADRG